MRRKSILMVLSVFLFFGLFAANLFAQDKQITLDKPVVQEQTRVIVEEIVLSDPTVAQPKKWLIGLSGEYWFVYNQYNRWENGMIAASGAMSGGMPGGTITAGYDAFTVAYSYRKGNFNCNLTFDDPPGQTSVLNSDQTEHEITARWLFKLSKHFNPYVLVGYNHTIKQDEETLDGASTWPSNGSRVTKNVRTYRSPLIGLGAIIPFNEYIGMRLDGRALYSWSDRVQDDGPSISGSGMGAAAVATAYWNIWNGINLQIGGKYQWLNGGYYVVGNSWKVGAFAMLGYTYKF